jgi:Flp pilus assembly pilin Flp
MIQFLASHLSRLQHDEAGQGLVEYLLILALVAFGAVAGMDSLATGLNSAFNQISLIVGGYIT